MLTSSFAVRECWVRLRVRPVGRSWELTELTDLGIRRLGLYTSFAAAVDALRGRRALLLSIAEAALAA